jgi:hypothetical protein
VTDDLREFADFVAAGLELVAGRDRDTWALGDLATAFDVRLGRPDDPEAPPLRNLARGWNVSPQRVSEWRNVAAFYPTAVRTFPVPWEMYNAARRAAEHRLDNALELLATAEEMHMGVTDFRRYLTGVLYEGPLQGPVPDWLRPFIPRGLRRLWLVVKVPKDGE